MSSEKILAELDNEQRQAASVSVNAVVAAGAGSGKTKVLAARYAWLVMDRKIPVDQILTLTFTNKAVSEMYSRIYGLLSSEKANAEACRAIANFHEAHISTLDSFSALIARQAARRYGITPEFKIDDAAAEELALSLSLPFVLEHRDNPELQMLLADKKIRRVAEELFAGTVLAYSPITRPLDFSGFMKKQQDELVKQWNIKTAAAENLIDTIKNEMEAVTKKTGALYTNLQTILNKKHPAIPGIENIFNGDTTGRKDFSVYFGFLAELKSISLVGGNSDEFSLIKDSIKELREPLYGELESIANMALQNNITKAVFPLVEKFQNQFNRKKREAGILTFNDIACLAVDALSRHPDIRQVYKDSCSAIMVDEFQDNNSLQRDLIFLLAEKPERQAQGIPRPDELTHDKMFFVGDEKQSIYRFRGADVSVFRRLAKDLSGSGGAPAGKSLSLIHNYRSNPRLIEAFNRIFGGTPPDIPGVFLNDGAERADFEAGYIRLNPPNSIESKNENKKNGAPLLTFCFLDKGALDKDDSQGLDYTELEAAFIAAKIRKMVDEGFKIQVRENGETISRPCAYGDFAVLQRSYSHQNLLEKQLKLFGIPFNADRPAGLFNDAPVNDLYHLLRLLAYPLDRFSYAAVIRSPFFRLSDETLTICLLDTSDHPFDEALEEKIPLAEEREKFQAARRHFNELSAEVCTLSVTELLTKLWFDEAYRYETIWTASAQIYSGLFDLFFEIARKSDESGKGLPDFIDHVSALISMEERADDLDIPSEDETGVRLMSIHKSKGLEFPVVFVYNCGGRGANVTNTESVFFSDEWGLSLNLPQADELSGNSGNYFFKTGKDGEKARAEAELRRLLYVAMTRAESALFVTASLPEQNKDEKEEYDFSEAETPEDFITNRIVQLSLKAKSGVNSFLDLLVPVIESCEAPPFYIESIPVLSRTALRRLADKSRESPAGKTETMFMAAEKAAPFYANTDVVFLPPPLIRSVNASILKVMSQENSAAEDFPPDGDKSSNLDRLLKLCKLEAADFGTIAHSFIEDHFAGRSPLIPSKFLAKIDESRWAAVNAEAKNMAESFFESELGKLGMNAVYRETEFPIITMVNHHHGKIAVRGQMDLIFSSNGIMYVVDFKTDRRENPAEHSGQLAVYAQAVSDIFGKPTRVWLFYLRGGHAVEMTAEVAQVNIEEMVDNAVSV